MSKIIGHIIGGKLPPAQSAALRKFFTDNEGKLVTIDCRNQRSKDQNSAWHGIVIPVCKKGYYDLGYDYTDAQTHEALLASYGDNIEVTDLLTGEVKQVRKSTKDYTTSEFKALYEWAQRFAAENLDCYIPDPDPDYKSKPAKI